MKMYHGMRKVLLLFFSFFFFSAFMSEDKDVVIYMIGDSTMANKDVSKGNVERGWGMVLPDLLTAGVRVENHAVNGRSSKSFIDEGRWDKVLQKLKHGDYVFIQFGHNDEKNEVSLHTVPGSSFDANLRRFVNEAREKGAIPVLFNSIARRNYRPKGMKENHYTYEHEGDKLVDTHGDYLKSPRNIAKELNVPFVDANKLTTQLIRKMGKEESKKLFMWLPAGKYVFCPKGKVDNTHLNIYGAHVVACLLINETVKKIPALKSYLRNSSPELYIAPYKADKQCAISYTFDDGLQEHYTQVYPYFQKLGFRGTFFVCGKIIEYKDAALGKPRMTWSEMKKMAQDGQEIASHGWSHLVLTGKTKSQIEAELSQNDSIIMEKIGIKPLTFAYPGNFKDSLSVAIASRGKVATRLAQYSLGEEKAKCTEASLHKWVQLLLLRNEWGVTMTHGISYGYDRFLHPDIFWHHLDEVKKLEDKIWVAPFQEVAAYQVECKNTVLKMKKKKNRIIISPSARFEKDIYKEPLTLVIKKPWRSKVEKVIQGGKELLLQRTSDKVYFDFLPALGDIVLQINHKEK